MNVYMRIDYIKVNLVSLPSLSRGCFTEVILQVSWLGRGRTAQSLYALKLRATIIGYKPPLVMYGSLKPLLGDIPASFRISHILPLFACDLALHFIGVCYVHASLPRVFLIRSSLLIF